MHLFQKKKKYATQPKLQNSLSADATLILTSEPQNVFRKWNVPLQSGTALSKEGSFAFTCHVKNFVLLWLMPLDSRFSSCIWMWGLALLFVC